MSMGLLMAQIVSTKESLPNKKEAEAATAMPAG